MQNIRKDESRFYTAADVSRILGISQSTSYRIIKKLNDNLRKQGFITIAGRVSKRHFEEKTYF